jgi:hypothetical protein
MLGRMENQDGLYRGMKDRFAYIIPERGQLEFAYRGRIYRSGLGVLSLKHPGEFYSELRREGLATFDIVFLDIDLVHAALGGSVHSEVVFPTPELASSDPRARALLQLHAVLRDGSEAFAREGAATEAATALALLARPRDQVRRETGAVARARAYLLERLAEPIRLDELADHVGMDKLNFLLRTACRRPASSCGCGKSVTARSTVADAGFAGLRPVSPPPPSASPGVRA